MRALGMGERVTWTNRDHGRDKRLRGKITAIVGNVATVKEETSQKILNIIVGRLLRVRGRKPLGA